MAKSKLSETAIKDAAKEQITLCENYTGTDVTIERGKAIDYYYSEPFGNEVEGRSSFVTSDVQDVVESIMPDLMEIFCGGGPPVEFVPKRNKKLAEQMTAACAYVWYDQNDGFLNTHDVLKDGLLTKNGFCSIQMVEDTQVDTTFMENVNSLGIQALEADDEIEIVEATPKPVPQEIAHLIPDGILYDLKVERTVRDKKCRVDVIPPENMLISPRWNGRDKQPTIGAKFMKTISELLEEGYPEDIVNSLPPYTESATNSRERMARYRSATGVMADAAKESDLTRSVWLYQMFFHLDTDGDGRAEYVQVNLAGPEMTYLNHEAVDDHPFVDFAPIRMPHMAIGRSYADLTMPFQLQHSTLWRQMFDNLFGVNNNRALVNERVNLDDYLTNRPGGAVRVQGQGAVGDAVMPLPVQSLGPVILPAFEVLQSEKEARTGETRYNQGIDSETLNKTMGGMNMILGQSQKRKLLVARLYAEGFKKVFKKIAYLLATHADRSMLIRLRGEYVEVDPRKWDLTLDLSVSVGLGHGTQMEKVAMAGQRMAVMEKIVATQGGVNGPLMGIQEVYQHVEDLYHATGVQNVEAYIKQPEGEMQAPQKGPSETEIWAQVEMQKAQIKAATEQQKMALDHETKMQELILEDERERARALLQQGTDAATLQAKAKADADKIRLDASKAMTEAGLWMRDQNIKIADQKIALQGQMHDQKVKVHELAIKAHQGERKANIDELKASQPKGNSNG
jgi:hypothetical protein